MCIKMKSLIAVILMGIAIESTAREFTQTGRSMSPTIEHGESFEVSILSSIFYKPKRWDVVVFSNPNGQFNALIGRIVGLPNERIFIGTQELVINDEKTTLPEKLRAKGIRYLPTNKTMAGEQFKNRVYTTNKNEYFILGDNSFEAKDSRFYGPVHRNSIANKVEKQ